jgi:hypothetical protein
MHVNRDIYGDYKECLNCGTREDKEEKAQGSVALPILRREAKRAIHQDGPLCFAARPLSLFPSLQRERISWRQHSPKHR